jgi:hypothetical protein
MTLLRWLKHLFSGRWWKLRQAGAIRFQRLADLDQFTAADLRLLQAFYVKRSERIGPLYYANGVSESVPDDDRGPAERDEPVVGHRGSLRALVDSPDLGHRLAAGRIIARILDRRLGFLDRQTESIEILTSNIGKRRVEFQLRPNRLAAIAEQERVDIDVTPLALVPKLLFHHVRFENDEGRGITFVTRREAARVAQCHLVAFAVDAGLAEPSAAMWEYLGSCVGRFPEPLDTDKFKARAKRHLRRLESAEDRAWLLKAVAIPTWPKLLANYEDSFLLMPRIPISVEEVEDQYVIEYTEPRSLGGPAALSEELKNLNRPSRAFAFRINEIGQARSHYVHLKAPPATFLGWSGLERLQNESALFAHRSSSSRSMSTFYIRRRAVPRTRSLTLLATIWPIPGGFLRPLRLVGWYTFAVAICFLVMRHPDAPDASFLDQLDGSISLLLFLPALLVGWLFRPEEGGLRASMIAQWRFRGALCVVALWLNLALGFIDFDRDGWQYAAVTIVYASTVLWSFYLALSIHFYGRRVRTAYRIAYDRELQPSRAVAPFVRKTVLQKPRASAVPDPAA